LSAADQLVIAGLRSAGTAVLLSGAETLWHLQTQAQPADAAFVHDVLGVGYQADDANVTTVDGSVLGLSSAIAFGDCSRDANCVEYPDVLATLGTGQVLLNYVGGGPAVVSADGAPIIVAGFPLESVANASERTQLIATLSARLLDPALASTAACEEAPVDEEPADVVDTAEAEPEPVELVDTSEAEDLAEAPDGFDSVEGDDVFQPELENEGESSETESEAVEPLAVETSDACSCRVHARSTAPGLAAIGLALGLLLGLRRRGWSLP